MLTGVGLILINVIKNCIKKIRNFRKIKIIIKSWSKYSFESENNNFQSEKLISGGVIGLRRACCRPELLCENAIGNISQTVTLIDLKIAQWDSEPKITIYQKFHRNLRGKVFWPGRSDNFQSARWYWLFCRFELKF